MQIVENNLNPIYRFFTFAKATWNMSFLLTYVPLVPLSQIAWINVESWAAYFLWIRKLSNLPFAQMCLIRGAI